MTEPNNPSEQDEKTTEHALPNPRSELIAALAEKHGAWLRGVAATLTSNSSDAHELVEETFQVAAQELDADAASGSVEVTLVQIAKRLSERRRSSVPNPPTDAKSEPSIEATSVDTTPKARVAPKAAPQQVVAMPTVWQGQRAMVFALLLTAALGALTVFVWSQESKGRPRTIPSGSFGRVASISRASSEQNGPSGLSVARAGAEARDVRSGSALTVDSVLRTDARTRARIELEDGSVLVLNHNTEVLLRRDNVRQMELHRGEIVANIAHRENDAHASIETPAGSIEVLGTEFVLAANEDVANVRVVRGAVTARSGGREAQVKAGEEGVLVKSGAPTVTPSVGLAAAMAWSDMTPDTNEPDAPVPGLGELRARRPGERGEGDRPLRLVNHDVSVNVQGAFARTDVVEVFRNDTDHELEGIYRFPLPADASIAGLALDVDGRMEEGVFVDSERAQRIWNGVIRHATPHPQNRPHEEWIWVPGPWRDPALLQWQRGGRFELRIFPIPAHGERRIAIHYTQAVGGHGGRRTYTYPLPHGVAASARAEHFTFNARIGNAEEVTVGGYDARAIQNGDSFELHYSRDGFEPVGDLLLEYKARGDGSELRTYAHPGTVDDGAGFVAFTLRPRLPASTESVPRDYVFVVDSSQSMYGERYTRAVRLVTRLVDNVDRTDRVGVLACDTTCAAFGDGMSYASADLSARADNFLRSRRPAGASDLVRALSEASRLATSSNTRERRDVHVVYIGDGVATIGERRVGSIAAEVERLRHQNHVAITTVGLGNDSDPLVLSEVARVGGGHYVPYVPGQRVSSAALAVLETTYGSTLQKPELELPACVHDVSPSVLPNLRSGEEVVLTGRFDCTGQEQLTLRGKVGGEEFVQHYPIDIARASNTANSFVPRLWARAKVTDLERLDRAEDRETIVKLSHDYFVMSRHTSLLVLESEAMMRAFDVDHTRNAIEWTGEESIVSGESEGTETVSVPTPDVGSLGSGAFSVNAGVGGLRSSAAGSASTADGVLSGDRGTRGGGGGRGYGEANAGAAFEAGFDDSDANGNERREAEPSRARQPTATDAPPPATRATPTPHIQQQGANSGRDVIESPMQEFRRVPPPRPVTTPPPPGRWMRRVWRTVREGNISNSTQPSSADIRLLSVSEEALRGSPDSRDRYRAAARAAARTGDLDRARALAEAWLGRDALDAEALTYLSDAVGRMGEGDEALRLLTGIVDLRPDDRALHERLMNAFRRTGNDAQACAFAVAIDEIDRRESTSSRASRCAGMATSGESMSGDVRVDASWSGGENLDISLITPQGTRLSWMGGRAQVFGRGAGSRSNETLGLRRATAGSYIVEIARTDMGAQQEGKRGDYTRGSVTITVLGESRSIPFTLMGARTVVGRAEVIVRRVPELVTM